MSEGDGNGKGGPSTQLVLDPYPSLNSIEGLETTVNTCP